LLPGENVGFEGPMDPAPIRIKGFASSKVLLHNRVLARWATRKYKKLKHRFRRAEQWLLRVAQRSPQLFAHWQLGARRGSAIGAV